MSKRRRPCTRSRPASSAPRIAKSPSSSASPAPWASGKSTTSRILRAPAAALAHLAESRSGNHRWVSCCHNATLDERGIADRKGFPESYDRAALIAFLSDIKSGKPNVKVPVYSHLVYDVIPGEFLSIDRPDILIVEGLNILQPGEAGRSGKPLLFASDFIDFSIYIDAEESDLRDWFMVRFRALRESAFTDPKSFFRRLAEMPTAEAEGFALQAWDNINLPNLRDNILPTRSRADLILKKAANHTVEQVMLRRV